MVAGFSVMACFSTHFLAAASSFVLPATFWTIEVCFFATIVKPSLVISLIMEAYICLLRRVLPPDGAICRALVVVSVMVHAVPFSAEVGVLERVDMGDMDASSWFELMEAVHCVRRIADKIR